MRRLLLLVLSLSLFSSNLVFANEELEDQNLEDYFLLEAGTEWTYIATTKDSASGTSEKEMLNIVSEDCDQENCTTWDANGSKTNLVVSSDGRMVTMDGEEFFSLDPFESTLGISIETNTCTTEFIEEYEILYFKRPTLKMSCTSSEETETDSMNVSIEIYMMKGVGMVKEVFGFEIGENLMSMSASLFETTVLPEGPFPDVAETSPNYEAISYLYEEGIIDGYEDGTFQGENSINRAELLKLLIEGQGITPDEETYANCFTDVGTDWYAKYVCYAKKQGWVEGYADGSFLPGATVNKVEALKMLLNSQGVIIETPNESPYTDVAVTEWFAPYVTTAFDLGLLEESGESFSPAGLKDREGVAENLYRLLLSIQAQVENASGAMAEASCLLFDEEVPFEDLENLILDIMVNYGYEVPGDIDVFIEASMDFPAHDQLTTQLESDLDEFCGSILEDADVDISDLAESMTAGD